MYQELRDLTRILRITTSTSLEEAEEAGENLPGNDGLLTESSAQESFL